MIKIELELISDSDIYLFLMDTIRGGICVVNKKHVIANNIYTRKVHDESSDKKVKKKLKRNDLNKFIMYLDANNLYGYSMLKSLQYKNFKWLNDLTLDPNNLKIGIYEVDIEIPGNLHDKFKDYPLCPEIKSINEDVLSEYQKYLNIKYSAAVFNIHLYGHLYDFSDYPKDHQNYNVVNKKVYGIFKDDLNGKILTEFTADKPKMYKL